MGLKFSIINRILKKLVTNTYNGKTHLARHYRLQLTKHFSWAINCCVKARVHGVPTK